MTPCRVSVSVCISLVTMRLARRTIWMSGGHRCMRRTTRHACLQAADGRAPRGACRPSRPAEATIVGDAGSSRRPSSLRSLRPARSYRPWCRSAPGRAAQLKYYFQLRAKQNYIRFERSRSLDAVSGIPTCAMESMKSSGLNDGARSRLRILATASIASGSSRSNR